MQPARRRGVTLLETVLAVFLSAMLVMLTAAAVNFYVRFVDARRDSVSQAREARAVLGRMAADLRSVFYLASDGGTSMDAAAATGDATSDPADDGVTAGMTTGTATDATTAFPTAAGLYGTQFELRFDTSRYPMPAQYDALITAGIDPRQAGLGADLKNVTYRLADPGEFSTGDDLNGTSPAGTGSSTSMALIRQVVGRARVVAAAELGDTSIFDQGGQLLTDQVSALEFQYFDGLDWYTEWDSELQSGLPMAIQITLAIESDRSSSAGTPTDLAATPIENVYRLTVYIPTAQPTAQSTDTTAGI